MFDVIAPIQSCLSHVPRWLDVLTSDFSSSRFVALEQSVEKASLCDVYGPWDTIDHLAGSELEELLVSVELNNRQYQMLVKLREIHV